MSQGEVLRAKEMGTPEETPEKMGRDEGSPTPSESKISAAQTPLTQSAVQTPHQRPAPSPEELSEMERRQKMQEIQQEGQKVLQFVGLEHSGLKDLLQKKQKPPPRSSLVWGEKVGVIYAEATDPKTKKKGKLNGEFTVMDENKTLIQGTWVDSYLHGIGQMKFASGTIFYGEFKQGMMDGQGYWKGVKGETYQGGWRMNYTHGPGLFTWPDGSTYHGDWHWGVMWGNGKYVKKTGDMTEYCGQFADGQRHGNGRLKFPNGDYHFSIYYYDQKWITFSIIYANGDVYSRSGADKFQGDGKSGYSSGQNSGQNSSSNSPMLSPDKRRVNMPDFGAPINLAMPERPPPPDKPTATLSGLSLVRCSITAQTTQKI